MRSTIGRVKNWRFWLRMFPRWRSTHLFSLRLTDGLPELPDGPSSGVVLPWHVTDPIPAGLATLSLTPEALRARVDAGDVVGFLLSGGEAVHRSFVQTRGIAKTESAPKAF